MYNIYIYLSTYIHFGLESLESFHFFWTQVCLTLNLERQAVALLRPRTKRQGIWVAVTLLWGSCGFWLQNLHSSFSEHLTLVWKRLTKLAFRSSFFENIWQTFSILFLYPLCKSSDLWGFSPATLDILWRHGMGRPEKDPGIQQSHGTKVGNQTIEPY
jgi:hypothetical protein